MSIEFLHHQLEGHNFNDEALMNRLARIASPLRLPCYWLTPMLRFILELHEKASVGPGSSYLRALSHAILMLVCLDRLTPHTSILRNTIP